ncbi:hypothetical protein CAEBREN_13134 [Caenorhabditis brenneri]|uniref:Uncharacterized protein n=1 Tax=Caenorhabditis brenneri TaxID=135651 RepID=G0NGF1_CAEBE|nr:hypothetical protein CAEBREN_13134 [Caenorhabditis brenneri]
MFEKRVEVLERYQRSGLEELPCQMKILEKAYTDKNTCTHTMSNTSCNSQTRLQRSSVSAKTTSTGTISSIWDSRAESKLVVQTRSSPPEPFNGLQKTDSCRVSPVCEAISPIQAGHDQGKKG